MAQHPGQHVVGHRRQLPRAPPADAVVDDHAQGADDGGRHLRRQRRAAGALGEAVAHEALEAGEADLDHGASGIAGLISVHEAGVCGGGLLGDQLQQHHQARPRSLLPLPLFTVRGGRALDPGLLQLADRHCASGEDPRGAGGRRRSSLGEAISGPTFDGASASKAMGVGLVAGRLFER